MNDIRLVSSFQPLFSELIDVMTPKEREEATVVLFVVSVKSFRSTETREVKIKKINLEEVSLEKFNKYFESHRLVPAIEKDNEVFARVSSKIANELKEQGRVLNFEGKDVKVDSIQEDEYVTALGKIAEAVKTAFELNADTRERKHSPRGESQTTVMPAADLQTYRLLLRIKNIPEKMRSKVLDIMLARMKANHHEVEEHRQEDEKKKRIKADDIKRREIEKQRLKEEIIKEDITKAEIKRRHK